MRRFALSAAFVVSLGALLPLGFAQQNQGQKNTPTAKSFTNSIGMKLALIPAGKFMMGSPAGEEDRNDNELQHEVEISKPFYMGVYAVTQEEYEKVMGDKP